MCVCVCGVLCVCVCLSLLGDGKAGGSQWGDGFLRLTAKILAFSRLTVNFFPLRLPEILKISFYWVSIRS